MPAAATYVEGAFAMRSRNLHLLVVLVAGLALVSFGTARAATAASVDLSAVFTSDCASDGGDLAFLYDQGTPPPAPGPTSTAAEPAKEMKCKTNKTCSKDDWCAKETGMCKAEGSCKDKPKTCPMDVVAPVCG